MSDAYDLNDVGLKKLIKAFKSIPEVRIGVLAGKSSRTKGGTNNAAVGAAHEFGTEKLPIRSFLRMPISLYLSTYLSKAGAFDRAKLAEVISTGSIRPWMAKVGLVAEEVVQDAFATGGFGHWKASDMDRKRVKQTLVESQQLRNAITSEVIG